jgi:hypothetical protein
MPGANLFHSLWVRLGDIWVFPCFSQWWFSHGRVKPGNSVSGLDPADPYFTGTHPAVRLDTTDALFVDVMHTDADSFLNILINEGGKHHRGTFHKLKMSRVYVESWRKRWKIKKSHSIVLYYDLFFIFHFFRQLCISLTYEMRPCGKHNLMSCPYLIGLQCMTHETFGVHSKTRVGIAYCGVAM